MDLKKTSLVANALAVPGVGTPVWTNTFLWGFAKNFSVEVQCATSTTPAIKIELELSFQQLTVSGATNYNQGATSIYYVIPDAFPPIFADIVDTNFHIKGVYPPFAIHGRYKITGLTGNPNDTTVTIYNMIQELGRSYGA